MKLNLEMYLNSDDFTWPPDPHLKTEPGKVDAASVAAGLSRTALQVVGAYQYLQVGTAGYIRDGNGQTIGRWKVVR